MDNYEYCAQWAARIGGRVLDYGCGAGQIVGLLRARGDEAFGCDVFYDGGGAAINESVRPFIVRMNGKRIPFPDGSFDAVISNEVVEHIEDLDTAVAEIARVLRPAGRALHMFPVSHTWREGHCGIPFLHWFPKRSALRVYYAAALRSCGMGEFHNDKTVMQWSRDFCGWLDQWTHYRTNEEIHRAFCRHFDHIEHREADWLRARTRHAGMLPQSTQRWIGLHFGNMVIEMQRHG
jgi:SAM-dependent methyltransferase